MVVGRGQVSNLASSLILYSPKCVEDEFSEVRGGAQSYSICSLLVTEVRGLGVSERCSPVGMLPLRSGFIESSSAICNDAGTRATILGYGEKPALAGGGVNTKRMGA